MKNKEWQRVESIFHTALGLSVEKRASYLSQACCADDALLKEVESLIDALERESCFLEQPALSLGMSVLRSAPEKSLTKRKIGCYQIEEKLGSGGMGDVYLAEDTRLGREVALKFLTGAFVDDKWAKRQLVKEAQAVAMIEHPNICLVYGIEEIDGYNFIVMQYVSGTTLGVFTGRQELSFEDALSIARQIISAVSIAHSHGIIHRDIKPGNIMITRDGQVKVLDFGLAKIVRRRQKAGREERDETSRISHDGLILGTISYMSPEQLRAEKLDYRTDIFSVGIVLYELFGRQKPFDYKSQAETIAAILNGEPQPLKSVASEVPDAIDSIIQKCLSKDKEKRFQSAVELLVELDNFKNETGGNLRRKVSRANYYAALIFLSIFISSLTFYLLRQSTSAVPTLAVMSVINESDQPDKDYLGDGLTANLVNKLSRLSNLKIKYPVFPASASQPQRQAIDPQNIGRELNADEVLTGKLVQQNNILIFQANLLKVADNSLVWSGEYEIQETNLLAVQEKFSSQIIAELRVALSDEERKLFAKHQTDDPEAFKLYMRGRYYWNQRDKRGNMEAAIECFKKATEIDPAYALAWAGLADSYALYNTPSFDEAMTPADAAMHARAAAKLAIQLDESSSAPYTSLGIIKMRYEWDWQGAENDFKTSIALDSEYTPAYYWYSGLLGLTGRYSEALVFANKAKELDPFSIQADINIGRLYFYARNYEQTARIYLKLLAKNPDNRTIQYAVGWLYLQTDKTREAIDIFEKIHRNSPLYAAAPLGYAYARDNRAVDALRLLDELERLSKEKPISPQEKAIIYIGLKDTEKAFENLNQACAERFAALPHLIAVDPLTDSLRSDPRFAPLIRCVNLPAN